MNNQAEVLKILAVGAVIFDQDNNILLHQNKDSFQEEVWEIFATYVRPGEKLEEALKRKIKEESGLDSFQEIVFTGKYYDDPKRHPEKTCIPFIFKVKVEGDNLEIKKDCAWFKIEDLTKLKFALDNQKIINDIINLYEKRI